MSVKHAWKKGIVSIEIDGWHAVAFVFILLALGVIIGSFFA